jgi:hypothetical protein
MNTMSHYLSFIRDKGRPLSEINPGSDEYGLRIDEALKALEILQETQSAILGGDILTGESGVLAYTYDNWYCEQYESESHMDFVKRSLDTAKAYIQEIAKRSGNDRYVVIVI